MIDYKENFFPNGSCSLYTYYQQGEGRGSENYTEDLLRGIVVLCFEGKYNLCIIVGIFESLELRFQVVY
jgi:hypothetical protein